MMNASDPSFAFDHNQLHYNMALALPAGSTSIFPLLDPLSDIAVPSGYWNSDHAQLHSDFASEFQQIYWPSASAINDVNLAEGPMQWWAFSNWQLHNLAIGVLSG